MENIKRVQLSEIAELITKGTTPTTLGYEFQDEGVNFLKIECFDEIGNYLSDKAAHISEECNEKLKRSQLKRGDVLFSIAGAIGRVGIVTEEMLPANTNQALAIIRINRDDVYLPYIKLILTSPIVKKQFERKKQGVAQLNLSLKDINELSIPLPDKEKQIEYANLFAKINIIMDQRNKELESLDELIKARFVELFGDKSKYRVEPLNDNVEEMFIGPFGSALKNECFVDEKDSYCMVYEQKHAIQKSMNLPTRYVDEKKYNELKRFTVIGGDVIVSCRGTIGEIYSIPEDAPMGIMHPSIMKIRLKREKYGNLFFVMMLEQYMQDSMSKAKGSGVKMAVTATELGKELFVVPDIEEQIAFETFVKQVDKSKVVALKAAQMERV